MKRIEMREHFDVPIDQVFELVVDFKRYPEWSTYFTEVKEVRGLPDQVGTEILGTITLLGRKFEGTTEIVEIEKPHLIKMSGTGVQGGVVTSTYRFTPTDTGTDAIAVNEYELPSGLLALFDKLFIEKAVEREMRHSLENFKALVELKKPALV